MMMYLQTDRHGVLAVHISNRFLGLAVLGNLASDSLAGLKQFDDESDEQFRDKSVEIGCCLSHEAFEALSMIPGGHR